MKMRTSSPRLTAPILRHPKEKTATVTAQVASHAGVFRGARISPLHRREGRNASSPKKACVAGYR